MKRPSLATKTRPSQTRSQDTFELIVETTGRLLEDVGFEQITTNLVCQEAKITPPALYRYFPNKYAILKELGDRLMKAQDEIVYDELDYGDTISTTFEERVVRSIETTNKVIEITRAFPGNIAITRALRAVPILKAVRLASRDAVAQRQALSLARAYPAIPLSALQTCSKLSIEMLYAATEMVLEEPSIESADIIEGACRAIQLYFEDFQHRRQ
jgi:AcrR family transcriptional regulator